MTDIHVAAHNGHGVVVATLLDAVDNPKSRHSEQGMLNDVTSCDSWRTMGKLYGLLSLTATSVVTTPERQLTKIIAQSCLM